MAHRKNNGEQSRGFHDDHAGGGAPSGPGSMEPRDCRREAGLIRTVGKLER